MREVIAELEQGAVLAEYRALTQEAEVRRVAADALTAYDRDAAVRRAVARSKNKAARKARRINRRNR